MPGNQESDFESRCPFPAILLYENELAVYENSYAFVTCGMADVRAGERGRFASATLIDSTGQLWHLRGAKVLHGVGPLWGWNLFLNRSVCVRPIITGGPHTTDLEFLRREVVLRLSRRDAFSLEFHRFVTTIGRSASRRLLPAIERATSTTEIISILLSADFPERERAQHATPVPEPVRGLNRR
jgi:hypothetical protein